MPRRQKGWHAFASGERARNDVWRRSFGRSDIATGSEILIFLVRRTLRIVPGAGRFMSMGASGMHTADVGARPCRCGTAYSGSGSSRRTAPVIAGSYVRCVVAVTESSSCGSARRFVRRRLRPESFGRSASRRNPEFQSDYDSASVASSSSAGSSTFSGSSTPSAQENSAEFRWRYRW